jgi:hypothetical protein
MTIRWAALPLGLLFAGLALGGSGKKTEVYITLGPETREQLIASKKARATALLADIKAKHQAINKIKYGPCMCGAPSHKACPTPEKCEPIEEKMMANLAIQAKPSYAIFVEVDAIRKELEQSADPLAVIVRRRRAGLQKEVAHLSDLRRKLDRELARVDARPPEEAALRVGQLKFLTLADTLSDYLLSKLPDDLKATLQETKEALKAALAAWGTKDEAKKREALAKAFKAARGSLRMLPGLTKAAKAALEATNRLYDLGFALVDVWEKWDRDHNKAQLRADLSVVVEKASSVARAIPALKLGAEVFDTAYEIGSAGMVLWHRHEEAQSLHNFLEKKQEARGFLQNKIGELDQQICFKQRRLAAYEQAAK